MSDDLSDGVEGVMGLALMSPGAFLGMIVVEKAMMFLVDVLRWMNHNELAWLALPFVFIGVLAIAAAFEDDIEDSEDPIECRDRVMWTDDDGEAIKCEATWVFDNRRVALSHDDWLRKKFVDYEDVRPIE